MLMFGDQKSRPFHDVSPAGANRLVVFGSGLGADHDRHVVNQRGIKGCRQSNGLRKNGGRASVGDAVQGFAPPVVGGNLQSRNRARLVHQLGRLLFQSHPRYQIVNPCIERLCRIQIGWNCRRLPSLRKRSAQQDERDEENVYEKNAKVIEHEIGLLDGDFRAIQRRVEYNIVNVHGKQSRGDPDAPRSRPGGKI